MSEPTISVVATCAAASAICVPILSALGVDVGSGLMGGLGVVIAQTLMTHKEEVSYTKLAQVAIGSVLFASIFAPLLSGLVFKGSYNGIVSAALGGFAQPILTWLVNVIGPIIGERVKNWFRGRNA